MFAMVVFMTRKYMSVVAVPEFNTPPCINRKSAKTLLEPAGIQILNAACRAEHLAARCTLFRIQFGQSRALQRDTYALIHQALSLSVLMP